MKRLVGALICAITLFTMASMCLADTTVELPTDEQLRYDANIFVAPANNSLKKAYDDISAERAEGSTADSIKEQYKTYYAPVLPVDYLELGGTTELTDPIPGYVNEDGDPVAVWNLPTLKKGYYYVLGANNYITMPDYTYPVIVLKELPEQNFDVVLRIYSMDTNAQEAQFVLTVRNDITFEAVEEPKMCEEGSLTVANSGLRGRCWTFDYDGTFRPYHTLFATFGQDYVVSKKDEPTNHEYYLLDEDYSLIMSEKVAEQTPKEYKFTLTHFDGFLSSELSEDTNVALYDNKNGSSKSGATTLDVYNAFAAEDTDAITYTLGPKSGIDTGVVQDNHTSYRIRTSNNDYEIENGAEVAFYTKAGCHIALMDANEIINPYEGMYKVDENNVTYLTTDNPVDLRVACNDYYLPIEVNDLGTEKETDCYKMVVMDNGAPGLVATKAFSKYHNLAAISFWNAWKSTVGGFDYGGDKTYTLQFETNGGSAIAPITAAYNSKEEISIPETTRENYKFVGWYLDSSFTTPFVQSDFKPEAGNTYTVYAKWKADLGKYKVTYYNDLKDTRSTETYNIPEQPVLPANPIGTEGKTFKQWLILDENGTTLAVYNPNTFQPVKDTKYTFKTDWATKGTITDVKLKKTKYYVGESVNKDDVRITVTQENNATRVIGSEEYTISPEKFTQPGTVSVVFTYTAGKSTASYPVTVEEDAITKLEAEWTGGKVAVGKKIDLKKVKVYVYRQSSKEKKEVTTDFAVKPLRITSEGSNSFEVTYSGFKTTFTVDGKKSGSDELNSNGDDEDDDTDESGNDTYSVHHLEASWEGDEVPLNGVINPNYISVKAYYMNDPSKYEELSSADFEIDPIIANTAGTTRVTVIYRGVTTQVSVPVSDTEDTSDDVDEEDYAPDNGDSSSDIIDYSTDNPTDEYKEAAANEKQPSTYYLHGHNIFTDFMSFGASQPINQVDILKVIKETPNGTERKDIELVNDSVGDSLTTEMLQAIKDSSTVYDLNMTDGNGRSVGKWSIDPEKMESVSYDFVPNIHIEKFYRSTDETCVGVWVEDKPEFAELSVDLTPYFPSGSEFEYYSLDTANRTPEDTVRHETKSQLGEYFTTNDQYFAVSDHLGEYYPTDYDLEMDMPWPSNNVTTISEEEGSGDINNSDIEGSGTQTELGNDQANLNPDLNPVTPEQPPTLIEKLRPVIFGGIGLILLAGIAIVIILIFNKRKPSNINPNDIDIPEDTEEIEDEEAEEYEEEIEDDEELEEIEDDEE